MEAVGLAISVAGLTALFDACLRGFDLIERGKDFSRDHAVLLTRFDAQRAMLVIWGDAVGLSGTDDFSQSKCLSNPHLRTMIKAHLNCISMIFEDASQLSLKYGLKLVQSRPNHQTATARSGSPFRSYLAWFQKKTSYRRKATWVMRDLKKFESMLDNLSKLIAELREITSSIADLERQRKVFMDKISQCTDIDELEIVEEALSAEDPVLSSAASERRTALTEAAGTVRSMPMPGADMVQDEDMETHADSDTEAQAATKHGALSESHGESIFEDEQTPLEISKLYGHQNNLGEIQEKDQKQIRKLLDGITAGYSSITMPSHWKDLVAKTVLRQLRRFQSKAYETPFISIGFAGFDNEEVRLDRLIGRIQAPPNTPYEGGVFTVSITIPQDYPFNPPICRFITPVYHANIDREGNICLDILTPAGWNPVWDLEQILTALCSLLGSPNCEVGNALVPEIAVQYLTDRYTYNAQARLHTQRYAAQEHSTRKDAGQLALEVLRSRPQSKPSTLVNGANRDYDTHILELLSCDESTDFTVERTLGRQVGFCMLLIYIISRFDVVPIFVSLYASTRNVGAIVRESLQLWLQV